MLRIDAHQHYWKFEPVRGNWVTENMTKIKDNFRLQNLQPILQQNGFGNCLIVQADREAEND